MNQNDFERTELSIAKLWEALVAEVDIAREASKGTRWASRVEDAWQWLAEQESIFVRNVALTEDLSAAEVEVYSATSGQVYHANGVCQCKATQWSNPCWHRAASKLVRNAIHRVRNDDRAKRERARAQTAELTEAIKAQAIETGVAGLSRRLEARREEEARRQAQAEVAELYG